MLYGYTNEELGRREVDLIRKVADREKPVEAIQKTVRPIPGEEGRLVEVDFWIPEAQEVVTVRRSPANIWDPFVLKVSNRIGNVCIMGASRNPGNETMFDGCRELEDKLGSREFDRQFAEFGGRAGMHRIWADEDNRRKVGSLQKGE